MVGRRCSHAGPRRGNGFGTFRKARVVRAADKLQMMIKVLVYESQHRGRLEEFWQNPKNFRDYDIQLARACFDRVCERSGNPKPR